ncbi:ankyrin repeat domain-containing protein [Uliginosibacterium sp. H1]|uniref:ankyrin repeat domain-containing protein n=1 Tax=Uliginosibacterium sp. H1 TaxID=3114757 RepID=UPI002E17AA6C|nr:ankyrin repeat domain-containing protein [Uliginosibacterium sp. H1]
MVQETQDFLDGALIQAADYDDASEVMELLSQGANPGSHNGYPLIMAIQAPSISSLIAMLEHGVDPNFTYARTTPLIHAIERCDLEMVVTLLSYGASPSMSNNDGLTPLEAVAQIEPSRASPARLVEMRDAIQRALNCRAG